MLCVPHDFELVPARVRVRLRLGSGRLLERAEHGMAGEYDVGEATRVDVLSLAFVDVLSRRLVVPRECVRLVWSKPAAGDGSLQVCEVRVEFQGLSDAARDDIEVRLGRAWMVHHCEVCYRPWVDEPWHECWYRCRRCEPLLCCWMCTLHDSRGDAFCMTCVQVEDLPHILETYEDAIVFRCRLLACEGVWSSVDG